MEHFPRLTFKVKGDNGVDFFLYIIMLIMSLEMAMVMIQIMSVLMMTAVMIMTIITAMTIMAVTLMSISMTLIITRRMLNHDTSGRTEP